MVAQGAFATGAMRSYCTSEDVLSQLSAYDVAAWGGPEKLVARTRALLHATRQAVDTEAGRDFWHHSTRHIAIDGTGTKVLSLSGAGIAPPAEVEAVAINGQQIDSSQWRYYQSAHSLKLIPTATVGAFTAGVQNVTITAAWGYATPPADIALAQAKLTCAQLISELSAEMQAVTALSIGDYSVHYNSAGRYGADIARLVCQAREIIRRYRAMHIASV